MAVTHLFHDNPTAINTPLRHLMRRFPILLLALLAVACTGRRRHGRRSHRGRGDAAEAADAGASSLELPVVGQEVVKGDLILTVTTRGEIKSDASAVLKAETGGLVQEVLVRPGDRVRRGQPLIRLDPEPLELALAKAEAALNAAKINYRVEIDVDSIATGQPPSDARREFVIAKAGIPTAEVNLREAKLALRTLGDHGPVRWRARAGECRGRRADRLRTGSRDGRGPRQPADRGAGAGVGHSAAAHQWRGPRDGGGAPGHAGARSHHGDPAGGRLCHPRRHRRGAGAR